MMSFVTCYQSRRNVQGVTGLGVLISL